MNEFFNFNALDTNLILIIISVITSVFFSYFIANWKANRKIKEYKSIDNAILETNRELLKVSNDLDEEKLILRGKETDKRSLNDELHQLEILKNMAKNTLRKLDKDTKDLQRLKGNSDNIKREVESNSADLVQIMLDIDIAANQSEKKKKELNEIKSEVDLYTQLDDLAGFGFFEMPQYLFQTSERFSEEIKEIREKQKEYIKNKTAVTYPDSTTISTDKSYNKKILDGQVKLMLTSFNIECDALIDKVSPSNYSRTLERIEKLANSIEKSAATLYCGFDIQYVKLKYKECELQYQFQLKKKEEQEEQRLIREQIREEQKAIKEYEKALSQSEKEEKLYRGLLEKARAELSKVSDEEKLITEQRISDLEEQLSEAILSGERAKSMAEQTKKGHVYIISNIGSFGDNVYKIGLTRRLEPLDRVKELSGASVPFLFDVHAMVYSDDAPALERALHREFTNVRVNAINLRKEFFNTDLISIEKAVLKIAGSKVDFIKTAVAEDFHETVRIRKMMGENPLSLVEK
mgnify:CR=1 FL=1